MVNKLLKVKPRLAYRKYEFGRLSLIISPQAEAWPLLAYCLRLLMALTLIVHARVPQKRFAPYRRGFFDDFWRDWACVAGVLRIITQAVLTATPRKRPPLGLLVIVKLILSENKQHKDIVQNKYHPEEQLLPIISLLMQDWYCNKPYSSTSGCVMQ